MPDRARGGTRNRFSCGERRTGVRDARAVAFLGLIFRPETYSLRDVAAGLSHQISASEKRCPINDRRSMQKR
jgi:hypothetical protein